MPRQMMEGDYRNELLVWILVIAFESSLYRVSNLDFHRAMTRYLAELKTLGVQELKFYPNIVDKRYPEVEDALFRMMELELMRRDQEGRATLLITPRIKHRLLTEQNDLEPKEVQLAQEAAQITFEAYKHGEFETPPPIPCPAA